ncbi:MAG: NADP-dependent phosphogluconate dehydrogenase [Phycisphaera sp.]|nr:NADP-dependent phosphogluconate dehydrogenase [Phycisphaera sp.]
MGQNLALNIADHGFHVVVYNRTTEKMTEFIDKVKKEEPSAPRMSGQADFKDFVASIKRPRKIIIMVQAGKGTDAVIDQLAAIVDPGDVIVDGGNAQWTDTIRREKTLRDKGIHFVGSGVSGGELGARFGPSLMPGGPLDAWNHIKPIWTAIAAKVDDKGRPIESHIPGQPAQGGEPCTAHIGSDGAGHYVKMVHNGIEYIDMQLICEAYFLMKSLLGMEADEMSEVFAEWNQGVLSSYLIEITADILQQRDPRKKKGFLVDYVLDTAGQKGTGKWTSTSALDMGVPANAMAEAVFARCLSALKDERVAASKTLKGPKAQKVKGKTKLLDAIHDALYCSKICAYAQGFQLMNAAQAEYHWTLDFGSIARIWRGGCIIRAAFLQKITDAYHDDPKLINLMLAPYFRKALHKGQESWRKVVSLAAENGVPCPAFMSALAYFDGYRAKVLPANLLQAQRDYFGAHTFERLDDERGRFFHVDWPEKGRPMIEA